MKDVPCSVSSERRENFISTHKDKPISDELLITRKQAINGGLHTSIADFLKKVVKPTTNKISRVFTVMFERSHELSLDDGSFQTLY